MKFILLFTLVFSANIKESYEDIIKKAQTLILQRDRDKALQLLQFSVEKESGTAAKHLQKTMDQMGEMIFTEKGQQLLEMAESMVDKNPQQAIEVYTDALKVESGNIYIESRIARAYFLRDDCDTAITFAEGVLQTHPWYEAALFMLAQGKVCKSLSLQLEPTQVASIKNEEVKQYVTLAIAYGQKDNIRLLKESELAIKKFPDFPDFYWFKEKASIALKMDASAAKEKYNELCNKSASALPSRPYLLYSCKHKEVSK